MPRETARILAAYTAGEKIEAIMAHYGVAHTTPRQIARRAGIPPRPVMTRRKYCLFGGHELSGDNLYVRPNGGRVCRACKRQREKERKQRRKATKR